MKLPSPIFELVRAKFSCHGCWHRLRMPDSSRAQAIRNRCFGKGELGTLWPKGLQAQENPGSGQDFLLFHRLMIRNFKWIVEHAKPSYQYRPWVDFPPFVASALDQTSASYRRDLDKKLNDMVVNATLDDLGRFIEGSDSFTPHIHFMVHGIVHDFEEDNYGAQPESDMGRFQVAALNEHFWGLHGWIDEIYAKWQRAHRQKVNQIAAKPNTMRNMCLDCMKKGSEEVDSTWTHWWKEYLASLSSKKHSGDLAPGGSSLRHS
jgi:hypothetical protein